MLEKLSQGQRVVFASVISIIFFISYEFFFASKVVDTNKTIQATNNTTTQTTPAAVQNTNSASAVQTQTANNAGLPQTLLKLTSNGIYEASIGQNGSIAKFDLLEPKFKTHDGKPLELFNAAIHEAPMAIRFVEPKLNEEALKTPYSIVASSNIVETNGTKVILTQKLSELTVEKNVTFYPDGRYDIAVSMSKDVSFFVSPGFRPTVHTDMMTLAGVLLAFSDDTTKTIEDGDAKIEEKFANVQAVAAEDHYYTTALYNFEQPFIVSITADLDKNPTAFIAGYNNMKLGGYIGPKNTDILASINPKLVDIVEYGYLTFMAKPMFDVLAWIEAKVGNWGWAIVIMTILVRVILFPITLKGMVSMNKIKDLAPKMQELREKYKGDPQKLNMHVLELYKKHNANPLSGCLPLLLQIPIFFALYKVLLGSVELKGAPWILWINDLSEMDPYFILPILMGITMFIQQRITPMNMTDPLQEKILKYLPVVFTVFFVTFPAGLTLYWFVSNVLSVAQQYVVNEVLARQKKANHHD